MDSIVFASWLIGVVIFINIILAMLPEPLSNYEKTCIEAKAKNYQLEQCK